MEPWSSILQSINAWLITPSKHVKFNFRSCLLGMAHDYDATSYDLQYLREKRPRLLGTDYTTVPPRVVGS